MGGGRGQDALPCCVSGRQVEAFMFERRNDRGLTYALTKFWVGRGVGRS